MKSVPDKKKKEQNQQSSEQSAAGETQVKELDEFRRKLAMGQFKSAELIIRNSSLPKDRINQYVGNIINHKLKVQQFEAAARIVKLFKLEKERYLEPAVRAYETAIKRERYQLRIRKEGERLTWKSPFLNFCKFLHRYSNFLSGSFTRNINGSEFFFNLL